LWDIRTGTLLRQLIGHAASIRAVDFAPSGQEVATGSDDGTARLWDLRSGTVVRQFVGHTGPIRNLAFSTDGRLLLTAENRATYLWQVAMDDVIATACAQLQRDFTADERSFYDIAAAAPTCP
jgi:WD40 repeat protein